MSRRCTPEASGPDLARPAYHVFVAGELLDPDRATRMEAIGGDADLRPHAEFTAVGELGGGVVQHDGAVDAPEEAFRSGLILRDDRLGVRRAVAGDVRNRSVHPLHDARRDDGVEVLRVPVLFAGRAHARVGALYFSI